MNSYILNSTNLFKDSLSSLLISKETKENIINPDKILENKKRIKELLYPDKTTESYLLYCSWPKNTSIPLLNHAEVITTLLLEEAVSTSLVTWLNLSEHLQNGDPLLESCWWDIGMNIRGFLSAVEELFKIEKKKEEQEEHIPSYPTFHIKERYKEKYKYQYFYERAYKFHEWLLIQEELIIEQLNTIIKQENKNKNSKSSSLSSVQKIKHLLPIPTYNKKLSLLHKIKNSFRFINTTNPFESKNKRNSSLPLMELKYTNQIILPDKILVTSSANFNLPPPLTSNNRKFPLFNFSNQEKKEKERENLNELIQKPHRTRTFEESLHLWKQASKANLLDSINNKNNKKKK